MSGKRYAEEFKIEAVKQVTDRGYGLNDVAKRLGVRPRVCAIGSKNMETTVNSIKRFLVSKMNFAN